VTSKGWDVGHKKTRKSRAEKEKNKPSGPVSASPTSEILHRRPGSDDWLERTNVFAARAVAKQNVEREHLYSPIVRSDAQPTS
jgi:hypothetical protein